MIARQTREGGVVVGQYGDDTQLKHFLDALDPEVLRGRVVPVQDQTDARPVETTAGQSLHDGPCLVKRQNIGRGDDEQLIDALQERPVHGIQVTPQIGQYPPVLAGGKAKQIFNPPGLRHRSGGAGSGTSGEYTQQIDARRNLSHEVGPTR